MEFKDIIKKLRRQRDMTQEELAEMLTISPQAVSRWETGNAMPDISLFPALCNMFDVSADYLLGIDRDNKEKNIALIASKADDHSSRGYFEEARKILEDGLRQYPNSYSLIRDLMHVAYMQSGDKETSRQYIEECISLADKILAGCTEDNYRHSAIQTQCYCYARLGDYEKAEELARNMPHMVISRDFLLVHATKGNACYGHKQRLIYSMLDFLATDLMRINVKLDSGEWAYTEDEMALIRDKVIAMLEIMIEDGNYGFWHCRLKETHIKQASYYAKLENAEKVLHHVDAAADSAIGFITWDRGGDLTCLLFRGKDGGSWSTDNPENDALEMLEFMKKKSFDFIRETPEFKAIEQKLIPYAGKWDV